MKESFIKKYKPYDLSGFKQDVQNTINTFLKLDNLNLFFIGSSGSGKTTIINVIIKEYFNEDYDNNILFINNLQEQGVNFCRSELKSFCQTKSSIKNKKKMVIVDDIDLVNDQVQHVLRNCLDKYSKNVYFIASCENMQKVIEPIISRMSIIKLKKIEEDTITKIYNDVIAEEKLKISEEAKDLIIKISENSVKNLLNYLEKLSLLDRYIDIDLVKQLCSNVGFNECEIYTNLCLNIKLKEAISYIIDIHDKGYSVIDVLGSYFIYVKNSNIIKENLKYEVTKLICKYITIFNELHEDKIELVFFTNNIINLFSSQYINENSNI